MEKVDLDTQLGVNKTNNVAAENISTNIEAKPKSPTVEKEDSTDEKTQDSKNIQESPTQQEANSSQIEDVDSSDDESSDIIEETIEISKDSDVSRTTVL